MRRVWIDNRLARNMTDIHRRRLTFQHHAGFTFVETVDNWLIKTNVLFLLIKQHPITDDVDIIRIQLDLFHCNFNNFSNASTKH